MKGQIRQLEWTSFEDDITKAKITRLTPLTHNCHRNYFYQKCFIGNDKLMIAGDLDGNRNYHLLDLKTATAVQITEGAGDNVFGGFIANDEKSFFYVKNNALMCVDLSNLQEKVIYQSSPQWKAYGTWTANSDCTKIVGIEILAQDWRELKDWRVFAEFYHSKPLCRMIDIDIKSGQIEVLLQENIWLGHPIYQPSNANIICFCHEGPHDLVDSRMWLFDKVNRNITQVKEHNVGESLTHEFWQPNGERLIYVSYAKGLQNRHICSFNPKTLQNEIIMQTPNVSHLYSNFDGSKMIGDGCGTPADVQDTQNYTIDNDNFLYLFDIAGKSYRKICQHKSSWQVLFDDRQITHPHPSFTPNEKQILFSSDFEGAVAVYLVDI
jgi:oligogalacturonide lyase